MAEGASAAFRVSPPRILGGAERAPRPPGGSPSADAHRQTAFILGSEVDLVLQSLELEAAVASASAAPKYRKQVMVAALGLWSRSWLARQQALHALEWGNYASAIPLVRSAADYQASALYVLRDGGAEWQGWLDEGGIALAPEAHATEFRLHAFRAAEVLAAHDILGPIYRATMDLSLSHFGSTLLLAGNESAPGRVLMTFGDRDFHLGLAELSLGWLLLLGVAQADALAEFDRVFAAPDRQAVERWARSAHATAARRDRCRLEIAELGGEKRYLVHNWRRTSGAAPKRILL
jgi:hypothetical protein